MDTRPKPSSARTAAVTVAIKESRTLKTFKTPGREFHGFRAPIYRVLLQAMAASSAASPCFLFPDLHRES